SDSRFPSLEVFERRPCLGGQQWSMKGRHPKTFTQADSLLNIIVPSASLLLSLIEKTSSLCRVPLDR
ncbi:MAG: hypothetical protein WA231_21105, partial [Methylocella sp.]